MKINIGIKENDEKVLFVTDDKENNIGELVISEKAYEIMLEELNK